MKFSDKLKDAIVTKNQIISYRDTPRCPFDEKVLNYGYKKINVKIIAVSVMCMACKYFVKINHIEKTIECRHPL